MAQSGERPLLFDTRGKRKHVIRVVYAVLALLMGASLFLVVGPFNLGELAGNSGSGSSAAEVLDEQAERLERRLVANPKDEELLLALTRARISAGNAQIEVVAEGEVPTVPGSAVADYETAFVAWNGYLKQAAGEPNSTAAQLVAGTFFRLAEASNTLSQVEENVAKAAAAQQIAAEQRPSVGSLSTLAIYEYFNGDFAAADKASKQAAAQVPSKAEAKASKDNWPNTANAPKNSSNRKRTQRKRRAKPGKKRCRIPSAASAGRAQSANSP
jgi:hypothetical protein